VLLFGLLRLALKRGGTGYIPLLRGAVGGVDVFLYFKIFAFPSSSAIILLISQETIHNKEEKSP
jgi:hypothetical protein